MTNPKAEKMKKILSATSFTLIGFAVLTAWNMTRSGESNTISESQPMIRHIMGTTAILGEGSVWDYKRQILYWIDIEKNLLYEYDPVAETNIPHDVHQLIGTIVPETENTVIVALKNGVYRLNLKNDALARIGSPSSLKTEERFNDGKCDPQGRFWVGTMKIVGKTGDSFLYRMNPDGSFTTMLDNVAISNGIIWSPNGKKMYYTDTPTRKVMAFDFDGNTGAISNPVIAVMVNDTLGHPDGMTIDAEGKLWVAMWGGHSVCRFDPENGKLLNRIEVPAKNVTSCAFGGPDLDMLYITTASTGMKDEEKQQYPNAGGLFQIKPGVRGIKANYFKPAG